MTRQRKYKAEREDQLHSKVYQGVAYAEGVIGRKTSSNPRWRWLIQGTTESFPGGLKSYYHVQSNREDESLFPTSRINAPVAPH